MPVRKIKVQPLTLERWADLEKLFGKRGACGGCWCMYWRITRSQFDKQKGSGNKRALKRITKKGEVPGLMAYAGGEPVAWCSLAPRETFPVLERSRVLKPVDDQPVWSIVCFFVSKAYRRRGVSVELLKAAVRYAKQRGAHIVEGYPVEPKKPPTPDAFAWTGLASAFRQAGFKEVERRSPTRPIMRWGR
jgi:GNAT superfamily N-acetyltransferase